MAEDAFMVLPVRLTGPGDIAWARLGLMDFVGDRMRRAGLQVLPSETTLGAIAQNGGEPEQGRGRVTARADHRGGLWQVDLEIVDGDRPVSNMPRPATPT